MAPPSIPGYALGRAVGRGGRSVVYAATDADTGSSVAIKVLNASEATDPRAVHLFRRELRAGTAVRHRHLVRVIGGNAYKPPYYLVMELLSGETLRQRISWDGRLDPLTALAAARQIASALAAVHEAGFVHADVKPENVRLTGRGGVKLVDLGFAHRPGEHADIHAAGNVMGTANYLAPELCSRPPTDGFDTDLFSLGVTLFEALTGALPYKTGTTAEVVRRHRDDDPADLREFGDFPLGVVRVVESLMARDPWERPSAKTAALILAGVQIGLTRRAG